MTGTLQRDLSTLDRDAVQAGLQRILDRARRAETGCLICHWGPDRHGSIRAGGGVRLGAHVAVALLRGDDLPLGCVVRHTCDVPGCIESTHLIVGTTAQNLRDRYTRNPAPGNWPRGEQRVNSILTAALVCEMRRRARAGETITNIAADLDVPYPMARRAIRGARWAWVTDEPPVAPTAKWSKPNPFRRPAEDAIRARALVAEGYSLTEIAEEMGCSRHTAHILTAGCSA